MDTAYLVVALLAIAANAFSGVAALVGVVPGERLRQAPGRRAATRAGGRAQPER
jgi:hypothetical protein